MKGNALGYLKMQGFSGMTIGRVESIVITIGTSAGSFRSIPVGAGKAGIDYYFLYPPAKGFPDMFGVGIEPPLMPPWISFAIQISIVRLFNCSIIQLFEKNPAKKNLSAGQIYIRKTLLTSLRPPAFSL
jgi:hypothetical protein